MTGLPDGSWTPATDADPAEAPAYGIALLSRHPVTDWQVVRLPPLPVRVPYRWPGARRLSWVRDEHGSPVLATVESPPGRCAWRPPTCPSCGCPRTRQLRHLLRPGDRLDLLLGDLNMPPAAATRLTGMRPLVTAADVPGRPAATADRPRARRHRPPGPDRGGALELPVSDHRALVVDCQPLTEPTSRKPPPPAHRG